MRDAFTEAEAKLRPAVVHLLYDRADAVERSRWEVDDITRLVLAKAHRLNLVGLIVRRCIDSALWPPGLMGREATLRNPPDQTSRNLSAERHQPAR